MTHRLKYLLGAIPSLPLLPLLASQGKRIRESVPKLPEAKEPSGSVANGFAKKKHVLLLGESTIAGVGVETHADGFPGSMVAELSNLYEVDIEWKVVARSGYTVKRVTEKLLNRIGDFKPDLIVLGLGGNDAFTLNTPWSWKKDTQLLINQLKHRFGNVPIVFTNMPPIKNFPAFTPQIKFVIGNLVEILGEELNQVANKLKEVYYDSKVIRLKDWVHLLEEGQDPGIFFSDGVHPSKLTYQIWGQEFAKFIHTSNIKI